MSAATAVNSNAPAAAPSRALLAGLAARISGAVAAAVDGTVATISPRRGLERRMYREALALAARTERRLRERQALYAAAKTTRLTGPWSVASPNVNDIIGASSPAVRARVRQLVRDFPYFARAVNVGVDYVVGPGIGFQARVKGDDGKLDKKINTRIEDAVKWWMDEADVARKLHFHEIVRLTKRQDLDAGEFIVVKVHPDDRCRRVPLALQLYESDWLSGQHNTYATNQKNNPAAVAEEAEHREPRCHVLGGLRSDPGPHRTRYHPRRPPPPRPSRMFWRTPSMLLYDESITPSRRYDMQTDESIKDLESRGKQEGGPVRIGPVCSPAAGLGAASLGALAAGAVALGVLAIGAVAVGRVVIGRLSAGEVRIKHLVVDRLTVGDIELPGKEE